MLTRNQKFLVQCLKAECARVFFFQKFKTVSKGCNFASNLSYQTLNTWTDSLYIHTYSYLIMKTVCCDIFGCQPGRCDGFYGQCYMYFLIFSA